MAKLPKPKPKAKQTKRPPRPNREQLKHWRADLRRQARLLARHPENDAIDAWIEQVYDWSEWR